MPNHTNRRPRTEAKKIAQKARTRKNKVKKYTKLVEMYPNSQHASIWKDKLQANQ